MSTSGGSRSGRHGLGAAVRALRSQPRHDIGNFLIAHRMTGYVAAPVRCVEVRPPGNHDGSEALVGKETQVGMMNDGAGFLSTAAIGAVACSTVCCICGLSACRVACRLSCVGRSN